MKHQEDDEQQALFEWAGYVPELRWMFAIPNGGKRNIREAARFKKQGVKAGVSDVVQPLPRGKYCGLYIEMKRSTGQTHVTAAQNDFITAMREAGYKAVICHGFEEAKSTIEDYLKL